MRKTGQKQKQNTTKPERAPSFQLPPSRFWQRPQDAAHMREAWPPARRPHRKLATKRSHVPCPRAAARTQLRRVTMPRHAASVASFQEKPQVWIGGARACVSVRV